MSARTLPGVQVCREAFLRLMGIGSNRLVRTREAFRGQDMRKFGPLDAADLETTLFFLSEYSNVVNHTRNWEKIG